VREALAGRTIRLYGTGEQRRDFNYVDDVVQALLLAGSRPEVRGEAFNLGHPRPCSLLEFVLTLRRFAEFDHEVVPFPPEAARIDVGDYYGDYRKFHDATGWSPEVELADGLERTVRHYRNRPDSPG
jgi:nucleoside-diphosphate-sugar epimerase